MSEIQSFLDLLKSDNHNKRYDACEQLRVWKQPLPQEAIDALTVATNDINSDVADAARRALALHLPQSIDDGALEREKDKVNYWSLKLPLVLGIIGGATPSIIGYENHIIEILYLPITSALLGAFISVRVYRKLMHRKILAFVLSFLSGILVGYVWWGCFLLILIFIFGMPFN